MIKAFLLVLFFVFLAVSVLLSRGNYDFLFFMGLCAYVISFSQLYIVILMDRFYLGMGVEIKEGWGDAESNFMKVVLIAVYVFVFFVSAFLGVLRE